MRKQEIKESDERQRMIADKAKSWTFSFVIMAAAILTFILSVLGYQEQALPFGWFVCAMVAIYWIFWLIAQKKY